MFGNNREAWLLTARILWIVGLIIDLTIGVAYTAVIIKHAVNPFFPGIMAMLALIASACHTIAIDRGRRPLTGNQENTAHKR